MEKASASPTQYGTEFDHQLALNELKWLRQLKRKLTPEDLASVASKYRFPEEFLEATIDHSLSAQDRRIDKSKWFMIMYVWAQQRSLFRKRLMRAYMECGMAYRKLWISIFLVVILAGYLVSLFLIWKVIAPIELILAVMFPYALFAIPYLQPLLDQGKQKKNELDELFEEAAENGYDWLARGVDDFIAKHARLLAWTNFKSLEEMIPEVVAYQIGGSKEKPIVIAENPEQSFLKRMAELKSS